MQSLVKRNINGIVMTGLLFAQVLMVGLQSRTMGETRLSYWTGTFLLPLQWGAKATSQFFAGFWSRYVWLVETKSENRRLDAEAARLRIENYFLQQELLRFKNRTELDAFMVSSRSEMLLATVVAFSPSRSAKEIFLDRGRSHGVKPGMAVVTPTGIVGKVAAAYGSSSLVVLITDSGSGAGVVLGQSGEPAVLDGTNASTCELSHVGPHVRVKPGEFVYTSGLDGVYPLGLPVGRVTSVGPGAETRSITVRPLAPLDRLGQVLVLLHPASEDLPEDLRQSLARGTRTGPGDSVAERIQLQPVGIDADRIKQAYRRTVASQGKSVGQYGYGGPPDFSAAYDLSRAAGAGQSEQGVPRQ